MASRYTDWFPPDIDPVHEGRYQRRWFDNEGREIQTGDGIWKGGRWYRLDGVPSLFECEWRGLRRRATDGVKGGGNG